MEEQNTVKARVKKPTRPDDVAQKAKIEELQEISTYEVHCVVIIRVDCLIRKMLNNGIEPR